MMTSLPEYKNTKITIPNQLNIMTSVPEQKEILTTISRQKDTITSIPQKETMIIIPNKIRLITSLLEQKNITKTIPNQKDIITTIPGQKDTMTSILKKTDSLPSLINLTITKNTEQITQDNLDNTGKTEIILLGFSNIIFDNLNSLISFYIYFVPVKNYLHSQKVRFAINIHYFSLLRLLQNKETVCTLENTPQSNQNKYLCLFQAETLKIKSIESNSEFTFESDDDVVIIGITPLARMYMDNLQFIDNKDLFETKIYILDYSTYKLYDETLINITGIIQESKPKFKSYNSFELIINLNSPEKKEAKLNCSIIEIMGNNYTLNCKINEDIDGDLQASISYIDKDLLIINFETGFDSKINLKEKHAKFNKIYYSQNKKRIKSATIIVISLAIIIVVVSLIIIIIIILKRKRKNIKTRHIYDSSRESINIK